MARSFLDDRWHHYSLRFDAVTKRFQVTLDGTLIWTSDAQSGGIDYAAHSPAQIYVIGEAAVHRVTMEPVVLTDEQVREIWARGLGWWP